MSRPTEHPRAAVVVIDACGAGALPDAAAYGDPPDANTIAHVAEAVGGLHVPTLERLGLGSIMPIEGVSPARDPVIHGRLHPLGPGKDSTTGHWELMGVVADKAPPTYPARRISSSCRRPACPSTASARSATSSPASGSTASTRRRRTRRASQ